MSRTPPRLAHRRAPPRWACEGLLWAILLFAPAAFGATEWWSRALLECACFALASLCALSPDFDAPFGGPTAALGAVAVLGVLQTLNARALNGPATALPETAGRPQTECALLMWAALAALSWSASGILRWGGALRRLAWAVFGAGAFVALTGILQRGQGNVAYYGLRPILFGRPFGPFTDSDHAAGWMTPAAFVGAGLFAGRFGRRMSQPVSEFAAQQVLLASALGLVVAAVLETGSRGAVNALVAAALSTSYVAAGALAEAGPRRMARAGALLAGAAYALFLHARPHWLGFAAGGGLDTSAGYRVSIYRSSLRVLADFPLFGVGLGGFADVFRAYQEARVVGFVDHAHSSWLEIAVEAGVPAFALFAAAALRPLAGLTRRLAAAEQPSRALCAGWLAGLLAFVLHGCVEFTFQIPACAVLFVLLLAGAPLLAAERPEAAAPRLPRPPRTVLAVLLTALALLSLPSGFRGAAPRLGPPFGGAAGGETER